MDTKQQTTAPLTRREAREIERRTGVRPVAAPEVPAAFAATPSVPVALEEATGEIERNAVASLVSVVPTDIIDRGAMAEGLRAAAEEAGVAGRMTIRAAKPAALVAKSRRRTAVASFAVAASALAVVAGTVPAVQAQNADQAAAHAADLAAAADAAAAAEQQAAAPAPAVADRVITDVVEAPATVVDRAGGEGDSTSSAVEALPEPEPEPEPAPAPAPAPEPTTTGGVSTGTSTDSSTETAVGGTSSTAEYAAVFPMPGGVMNEGFGTRGGGHHGLDIVMASGSTCGADLVAVESGTVTSAAVTGGYGNAVTIKLDSGVEVLYGHLTSYAVSTGQHVSAGQTIGYAGTTGNSTGCHLHFEVHESGSAINPQPWLAARGL